MPLCPQIFQSATFLAFNSQPVTRNSKLFPYLHLLSGLQNHVDTAHHVKGLLGDLVMLAVDYFLEAADGVLELDILALPAGEYLGHEERLRKEFLDFSGARYDDLVVL